MEETGNSIKKVPLRETNVIQEYLDGMAIKELAEKYDRSHQSIGQFLRRQGIETEKRIQTKSPYTLDEHWLDELDCEEKAYFLGYFYADGGNSIDRNQIRIKLNIEDKYILERFRSWFKSNRPLLPLDKNGEICTYKGCKELDLTSEYLCRRLKELGAPATKSAILKFPDFIPEELMNHFIRGYFDGDGNISVFGNNKNGELRANITITSSNYFIDGLYKYILNNLGINSRVDDCEGKVYKRLQIEKNREVKKFLDWMYKDATVYLTRKCNDYIKFSNSRDFSKETSYEKRDRIRADSETIISRYLNGESATTISKDYDCSTNVITRLLKSNNIEIRKNTTPQQRALKAKENK